MLLKSLRKLFFSNPHGVNSKELERILRNLCFSGELYEAVKLLSRVYSSINPEIYALLLQECINRGELGNGKRIHVQMIMTGFKLDEYLKTKLVILYAKNGDLETAHQLFDRIPERNLVLWNAMISGYVKKGLEEGGLRLYHQMRWLGFYPDQFTFASVFRACARMPALREGIRAHCIVIKSRIIPNVVVNSALVDMYFKCSDTEDGRCVFDESNERNLIMWTALISGYGQHGHVKEVLGLFNQMTNEGYIPNHITFLAVLSACGHGGLVDEGWKYFLSMINDYGIRPRGEHYAALVDLLGRSGRLREAYEFVLTTPCKERSVIWGALLGACRIHGDPVLLKLVREKFFELDPGNAGKHVVLSNTYSALGYWELAATVRDMMRLSCIKKEPGFSSIEVGREVHAFHVGDKSHKLSEEIYKMIEGLDCILKQAD